VPLSAIKRHILSSLAESSNRLVTFLAYLSEEFDIALRTVGVVILGSKLNMSQLCITLSAEETFSVEGSIAECHTSLQQHISTLAALLGEVLIVTWHTDQLIFLSGYKAVVADRLLTDGAQEAGIVVSFTIVLKLLHTMLEGLVADVASLGKVVIVAVWAVQTVIFTDKLLVSQRSLTTPALEAVLVPMSSLVG